VTGQDGAYLARLLLDSNCSPPPPNFRLG
jgi:hypothetical protein